MKIFEDSHFWNRLAKAAPSTSADPKYRRLYYQCDGEEYYIQIEVGAYQTSNVFRNKYHRVLKCMIPDILVADIVVASTRDTMFMYTLTNEPATNDHLWQCDPATVEHHLMLIKLQLPNV